MNGDLKSGPRTLGPGGAASTLTNTVLRADHELEIKRLAPSRPDEFTIVRDSLRHVALGEPTGLRGPWLRWLASVDMTQDGIAAPWREHRVSSRDRGPKDETEDMA